MSRTVRRKAMHMLEQNTPQICTSLHKLRSMQPDTHAQCYCGNAIPKTLQVADTKCAMACSGTTSEVCGGPNLLTVYYSGKAPASVTTPPASPVNPATIAPFKYQGCYLDNTPAGRTLAMSRNVYTNNTVEYCLKTCAQAGYTIAGVEYGTECYCDNFIHTRTTAPESDCNMPCAGNAGEKCGAGNRLSLYSNGATMIDAIAPTLKTTGLPAGWSFQGCLSDKTQKTLPYLIHLPTNNTNEGCMAQCQKFGYNAAGTEYSVSVRCCCP